MLYITCHFQQLTYWKSTNWNITACKQPVLVQFRDSTIDCAFIFLFWSTSSLLYVMSSTAGIGLIQHFELKICLVCQIDLFTAIYSSSCSIGIK